MPDNLDCVVRADITSLIAVVRRPPKRPNWLRRHPRSSFELYSVLLPTIHATAKLRRDTFIDVLQRSREF